jgi:hypothetical protein
MAAAVERELNCSSNPTTRSIFTIYRTTASTFVLLLLRERTTKEFKKCQFFMLKRGRLYIFIKL